MDDNEKELQKEKFLGELRKRGEEFPLEELEGWEPNIRDQILGEGERTESSN